MRTRLGTSVWVVVEVLVLGVLGATRLEHAQAEEGASPIILMPSSGLGSAGPEHTFTNDQSGITIFFHSPGELLLTDPQGRRLGVDPRTGQSYTEIPNADYGNAGLDIDAADDPNADPPKELNIFQPIAGEYSLDVIGTGEGTYTLEIITSDVAPDNPRPYASSVRFTDLPIAPGSVHRYGFNFAKTVGVKTEFFGGFNGGGQRPKDVNKFLSYSSPTQSQTTLPAGTTTYPMLIHYNKAIIAGSFKAELNGVNVASLFHPLPGDGEVVPLNLQRGRNVLVLSVEGTLPTRVARDTDRLVFVVP